MRHRNIIIGSIEPLVVDTILRIYIGISGIEQLVVDTISRIYIGIGGVEPLVVEKISIRQRQYLIILIFSVLRGEVLWGGLLAIESDMT